MYRIICRIRCSVGKGGRKSKNIRNHLSREGYVVFENFKKTKEEKGAAAALSATCESFPSSRRRRGYVVHETAGPTRARIPSPDDSLEPPCGEQKQRTSPAFWFLWTNDIKSKTARGSADMFAVASMLLLSQIRSG